MAPSPGLVGRAVKIDHQIVDPHLLGRLDAADRIEDFALGVGHGLPHALAAVAAGIAVAQLHRLMRAGRGAGGHGGAALGARFEDHVDLDGGIAPAVEDFTAEDVGDGGHARVPMRC